MARVRFTGSVSGALPNLHRQELAISSESFPLCTVGALNLLLFGRMYIHTLSGQGCPAPCPFHVIYLCMVYILHKIFWCVTVCVLLL